ncbi:BTAD domain-containing putative transcriptional regulator [Saccharothrix variisporea]|uniref:DNA-binding SARP family transcriptional activator n=1 Tax=Saccharothrix variisporea TaxID=543527 RepID=A0A495XNM1_9PSEU|nr:BTAD domain-containing putative transcriptional regulator [Saccharothrix variisporea]RKT74805.1 DNA-binding SARP family transcriptional activator [Saccharothrix variisporea]
MFFRVLGPLDLCVGDGAVQLGGIKQRATLGFLLLHPNRVVSTSGLVDALWTGEDPPASARKMLQNAVWGLRGILAGAGGPSAEVSLRTKAPGYVLDVDPERVDLFRFRTLVADGRRELAEGGPDKAAALLRDALALWRGPVLADLVEAGVEWSDLASIQTSRLAAMEDRFEAELRCGGHYAVLGDLESMVEAEPFRERSVAQLMLALYRCGRQADALAVYARFRTALADELGLDPGADLQQLHQSILEQSPALAVPGRPTGLPSLVEAPLVEPVRHRAPLALAGEPRLEPFPVDARQFAADARQAEHRRVGPTWRQASALIVRTEIGTRGWSDGMTVDDTLHDVAAIIREETERCGGVVLASIGSYSLALFEANRHGDDFAKRAVMAALAIRDRTELDARAGRFAFHTAVATGETTIRNGHGGSQSGNGALMVACEELLSLGGPGEVMVCERTRMATAAHMAYERTGELGWRVAGCRCLDIAHDAVPPAGYEHEMDVLEMLLTLAVSRKRPMLASVLGVPGSGKSWFLSTFESRVADKVVDGAPLQVVRTPPFAGPWGLRAAILAACCGVQPGDPPSTVEQRLYRTVQQALGNPTAAELAMASLGPLLEPGHDSDHYDLEGRQAAARDWNQVVSQALRDRPLAVFIDDLHLANDGLLNFIEGLAGCMEGVPLMVVVGGRLGLLQRRPDWGGGKSHATTLTLDVVSRPGLPLRSPAAG